MLRSPPKITRGALIGGLALAAILVAFGGQSLLGRAPSTRSDDTIEPLSGVWIEGPGIDVTYGGTYDSCVARCLANTACLLIEFYRPEKKCNLYDELRPRKTGGASNVGIRRPRQSVERR